MHEHRNTHTYIERGRRTVNFALIIVEHLFVSEDFFFFESYCTLFPFIRAFKNLSELKLILHTHNNLKLASKLKYAFVLQRSVLLSMILLKTIYYSNGLTVCAGTHTFADEYTVVGQNINSHFEMCPTLTIQYCFATCYDSLWW